jgi:probable HAF family extracellular repeat protein
MRPRFNFAQSRCGSCCRVVRAPGVGTHMLKRGGRSIALALLLLSLGSRADAQGVFTIDVPGATFTRIFGLNAQGDVCGGALLNGIWHAFVGSRRADFTDLTSFVYPGSVFTQCRGINAVGQMVGVYQSTDSTSHAFLKDGSDFISIDVPGATDTRGFGIDPLGQIVGRYTSPEGIVHGFFRSRDGVVLTIDGPGATATEASGITPQGEITGVYRTADGKFHGFILSKDGFQTIDVPGAAHTGTATGGMWMSASGELAGYYQPQGAPPGQNHAWLRLADATFHTYQFPGSVDTCFFNVNERGDLVGRYVADGVQHGLYVDRLGRRPPSQ